MRGRAAIWLVPLVLALLPACSSASTSSGGGATGSVGTAPSGTGTVPPGGTVSGTTTPSGGVQPSHPPRYRAKIRVSPAVGGPNTDFVVTFKAPAAAGVSGVRATSYQITALGPQGGGCQFSAAKTIRKARKGQHERIVLRPQAGGWCRGTMHGTVELISGPNCTRGQVCPEFVSIVSTVGHFKFRVK